MTRYVFIEARDPFESHDTQFIWETATALQQRGHPVTVFLIQNATLAARRNVRRSSLPSLATLAAAGIQLLADEFSLRERGIATAELSEGIQEASIETLVDLLAQDTTKAVWH
jgi:predicted peroxiredoxin